MARQAGRLRERFSPGVRRGAVAGKGSLTMLFSSFQSNRSAPAEADRRHPDGMLERAEAAEPIAPDAALERGHAQPSAGPIEVDHLKIAGIRFDFILATDVVEIIRSWRGRGQRRYVVLTNPHSVMTCRRDARMAAATEHADLRLPDGVGVVLASKILGYGRRHRVTGPNLMLQVCDAGRKYGLRHFFYGGSEGVVEKLAQRLHAKFPG